MQDVADGDLTLSQFEDKTLNFLNGPPDQARAGLVAFVWEASHLRAPACMPAIRA
ncbi:hypothetical protein GMO_17740 [Gluconobacter morbifer G707]|uniref:Uncharacterized protein n=1 Tax=Gluconobacter morbifer G707 TaxID=1088869 RepID=G6XK45_9PROT|nr:hypothetical protein GMO_17740 [Gluconobacter morbifer G707]